MPRSVSLFSAWYLGLCDFPSLRRPLKPLQGADRKTMCGRSWPAAAWMSAGVASRQPDGGVRPWNASYCSRSNRSSTVPGTPARRPKSRMLAGSTSMPPMQRKSATMLPTRAVPRLKPRAPPPRPQNRWKCRISRRSSSAPGLCAMSGPPHATRRGTTPRRRGPGGMAEPVGWGTTASTCVGDRSMQTRPSRARASSPSANGSSRNTTPSSPPNAARFTSHHASMPAAGFASAAWATT